MTVGVKVAVIESTAALVGVKLQVPGALGVAATAPQPEMVEPEILKLTVPVSVP